MIVSCFLSAGCQAGTQAEKIDILGWSWGTVTVSRFLAGHGEHINRVILYAPILSGVGAVDVTEPFHHNTNKVLDDLPGGSELEVIEGASHVAYVEAPYYQDFQNRLVQFLDDGAAADSMDKAA
ncbi:hypothetical protein SAMN02910456_02201 [Ruminococcaceae bacterium YRB3002]|nr:hypothetical protein SAMN02910456_02201 [Ruminococcaceae bacterium YRB3002]